MVAEAVVVVVGVVLGGGGAAEEVRRFLWVHVGQGGVVGVGYGWVFPHSLVDFGFCDRNKGGPCVGRGGACRDFQDWLDGAERQKRGTNPSIFGEQVPVLVRVLFCGKPGGLLEWGWALLEVARFPSLIKCTVEGGLVDDRSPHREVGVAEALESHTADERGCERGLWMLHAASEIHLAMT